MSTVEREGSHDVRQLRTTTQEWREARLWRRSPIVGCANMKSPITHQGDAIVCVCVYVFNAGELKTNEIGTVAPWSALDMPEGYGWGAAVNQL